MHTCCGRPAKSSMHRHQQVRPNLCPSRPMDITHTSLACLKLVLSGLPHLPWQAEHLLQRAQKMLRVSTTSSGCRDMHYVAKGCRKSRKAAEEGS